MMPPEDAILDSTMLRRALSHFATGVAVVATRDPEGLPVGLTVNSFTSVSLDPPLIAWSLISRSRHLSTFRAATHFSANILGVHQQELCNRFATPQDDRFVDVGLESSHSDVPVLSDVVASFECRIHDIIEAGDHHMILGHVIDIRCSDHTPLIYCKGIMQGLPLVET